MLSRMVQVISTYFIFKKRHTESFVTTMEDVESRIDYTVVSDTEASVKRNRKFLISVFGALEYFCRQSIIFREHRDDGNIFDKEQNNANKS